MNSLLPLFFLYFVSFIHANDINVANFNARGDGKTDASPAFLKAWASACGSTKPTTIYVPRRTYLLRPVVFQGPCKNSGITLRIDGFLVAPDYKQMRTDEYWLKFVNVKGVSIVGGNLDGKGSSLWACKSASTNCPTGATSLAFYNSKDVLIQNLKSTNAKIFHIVVHTCENVILRGVSIQAPKESPNTDGIHVQNSINTRIQNAIIKTGDDCVSIGPGTQNLWIERVACGPGHGISIGSLGKAREEEGVQNVMVKNVVFSGTQNGLRIKSWGRPSNGFVKGVVFKQIVMKNVENPIIIDQNYCPHNEGCPYQSSGIKISGVTYSNIKGSSATQVAMKFDCSAATPCRGINLQDIKLTYGNKPAKSLCHNIKGNTHGLVFPQSCL